MASIERIKRTDVVTFTREIPLKVNSRQEESTHSEGSSAKHIATRYENTVSQIELQTLTPIWYLLKKNSRVTQHLETHNKIRLTSIKTDNTFSMQACRSVIIKIYYTHALYGSNGTLDIWRSLYDLISFYICKVRRCIKL